MDGRTDLAALQEGDHVSSHDYVTDHVLRVSVGEGDSHSEAVNLRNSISCSPRQAMAV